MRLMPILLFFVLTRPEIKPRTFLTRSIHSRGGIKYFYIRGNASSTKTIYIPTAPKQKVHVSASYCLPLHKVYDFFLFPCCSPTNSFLSFFVNDVPQQTVFYVFCINPVTHLKIVWFYMHSLFTTKFFKRFSVFSLFHCFKLISIKMEYFACLSSGQPSIQWQWNLSFDRSHYRLQEWTVVHTITEAVKGPQHAKCETIHKTRQSTLYIEKANKK